MITRQEAMELVLMSRDPDAYPEHDDEIYKAYDGCASEIFEAYAEGRLVDRQIKWNKENE